MRLGISVIPTVYCCLMHAARSLLAEVVRFERESLSCASHVTLTSPSSHTFQNFRILFYCIEVK